MSNVSCASKSTKSICRAGVLRRVSIPSRYVLPPQKESSLRGSVARTRERAFDRTAGECGAEADDEALEPHHACKLRVGWSSGVSAICMRSSSSGLRTAPMCRGPCHARTLDSMRLHG
jgi:hypothetical protein